MTTSSAMANDLLNAAIEANRKRTFYAAYPEVPKAYPEDANQKGLESFQKMLNQNFTELQVSGEVKWVGGEISPYMQTGLGIHYPALQVDTLINHALSSGKAWAHADAKRRAEVLIDSLERVKNRFFEIAYATMHTTGQSFIMSFQASGPHANDRALEAIAAGVEELGRYPAEVSWSKPMGKFDLVLKKNYKPVPKGINLVIGCSTFPTWNTVPGLYAGLITGNPVIVKPHPKSILPIAIVVAEIRNALTAAGFPADVVQLAPDTIEEPVTQTLAQHPQVKLIDYTGGPAFGNYIETLGKTCFTEKAGVNPVIIDSVSNLEAVCQNLAFSVSLYSGQMCTAPQYIFVPETGVNTDNGTVSFDEFVSGLSNAVKALVENPKAGPYTLGAIQNELTISRAESAKNAGSVALDFIPVTHPEFADARMKSPAVLTCNAAALSGQFNELFGPVVMVVKTKDFDHSLRLAAQAAAHHGAITCMAYSTDVKKQELIEETMNGVFTPVSFNFTGAAFVNQHAAFSDFHVTGGNPAGNATFTNADFINRRFVWVGNRYA